MYLLFEKRLGFKLYRPIGLEWFTEKYWMLADPYENKIAVAKQYLEINHIDWKEKGPKSNYIENQVYYIYETAHGYHQRAITLNTFKELKFDLIVSTYEFHDFSFEKLKNEYQPSAKNLAQMGNVNQRSHLQNIIHSVPYTPHPQQHSLLMHQEIDTHLYSFIPPLTDTKNIYSVVSLAQYLETYNLYKSRLNDCNFKYYGITCPDGVLSGCGEVAKKMIEANIGWSLKSMGGLGHSNMGWCFSGRPLVTNMSQHRYFGGNALKIFESDVTCIDIESNTINENCKKIKTWLEPENTIKHGTNLRNRFLEVVNYDEEFQKFKKFLEEMF
jgi:hypothetical protein